MCFSRRENQNTRLHCFATRGHHGSGEDRANQVAPSAKKRKGGATISRHRVVLSALQTRVVAQEKQKSKQNERDNVSNNIRHELLHVGDKVALVNDGLLSKLESKYHGP